MSRMFLILLLEGQYLDTKPTIITLLAQVECSSVYICKGGQEKTDSPTGSSLKIVDFYKYLLKSQYVQP